MRIGPQARKWLAKRAKRGMRGYPIGTIAFYGPDDRRATKVAVGIKAADAEPTEMHRWLCESGDARTDERTGSGVVALLRERGVKTVIMPDRIIGCPHEEGVDYPEGEVCPRCPFWIGRNRWTGKSDPQ